MNTSLTLATATFLLSVAGSTQAADKVATASTLKSVFAGAAGGDTIHLTGAFGYTRLENKSFGQKVRIDAAAATFSDLLFINNISNLDVIGGHYGSNTAVITHDKAVEVVGGSNISFVNPSVTGFYTGHGITFTNTTNARISGGTFSKLHNGVVFGNVTGGSISNSTSIFSVSDGFDITNSRDIVVDGNQCSGTTPLVLAHPDCVQLWSSPGMAPQDNIAIRNNYATGATQGFSTFGSNKISATNISITDNRVDGLFPQGIGCYLCINSTIARNVTTSLDGASYKVNINVVGGSGNAIFDNRIGVFNRAAARATVYYTRAQLIGATTPQLTEAVDAVPESQIWAMMIGGFGLVGAAARRRRLWPAAARFAVMRSGVGSAMSANVV